MAGLTIRMRLILLTTAGLLVLIATNVYLTRALGENSAGMVKAAGLLKGIEQADGARIAFGEMRYWMTDLAVSELTLSERNAAAARGRMEDHLKRLAPWNPERVAAVRSEVAQYDQFADKAVDEYTNDRRVIGNSLLAQARLHSVAADQLLGAIVADLTDEAVAARQKAMAEAAAATRLSRLVVAAAVLVGIFLTFLLLRAIVVPLRRLVGVMDGLNAGHVDVAIPKSGSRRDRRRRSHPGEVSRHPQGAKPARARAARCSRGVESHPGQPDPRRKNGVIGSTYRRHRP